MNKSPTPWGGLVPACLKKAAIWFSQHPTATELLALASGIALLTVGEAPL